MSTALAPTAPLRRGGGVHCYMPLLITAEPGIAAHMHRALPCLAFLFTHHSATYPPSSFGVGIKRRMKVPVEKYIRPGDANAGAPAYFGGDMGGEGGGEEVEEGAMDYRAGCRRA